MRELRNAIEYAVIRSQEPILQRDAFPPEIRNTDRRDALFANAPDTEKGRILAALAYTDGNRSVAAKLLGISRATFYRRLADLGIKLD